MVTTFTQAFSQKTHLFWQRVGMRTTSLMWRPLVFPLLSPQKSPGTAIVTLIQELQDLKLGLKVMISQLSAMITSDWFLDDLFCVLCFYLFLSCLLCGCWVLLCSYLSITSFCFKPAMKVLSNSESFLNTYNVILYLQHIWNYSVLVTKRTRR